MNSQSRIGVYVSVDSMGEGWTSQYEAARAFSRHLLSVYERMGYTNVNVLVGQNRGYVYIHNGTHAEEQSLMSVSDEVWAEWICSPESDLYAKVTEVTNR